MTYGSRVGTTEFDTVNGTGLGGGLEFALAYNLNDLTLSVVHA